MMAARITELEREVEEGVRRCECGGRYQVYKREVKFIPRAYLGPKRSPGRSMYVPSVVVSMRWWPIGFWELSPLG